MEELQICSNNYRTIGFNSNFTHENLHRLYISNNHLTDWRSICRLGQLFPRLQTLIASGNPLTSFRSTDDDVQHCLTHLQTLSVDQVEIQEWNDIVALTDLPRLNALRIHQAPLLKVKFERLFDGESNVFLLYCLVFQPYSKEERFFLFLGYMKHLKKFNGSDITGNERETSERRFIRYYSQRDDKPQR